MSTALSILYIIIGYLIGSVCSAIIVCRIFSLPDPRTEGSNNPGATNVLRIGGPKCAIIVLVADMLKGFLPVILFKLFGADDTTLGFVCVATVFGHMFPVFFQFKGGKGVATALGAMIGLNWLLGALVVATWLAVAVISRYSSLAAVTALVLAPFYSIIVTHNVDAFVPLAIIAMFVVYKHHANITRLIDGSEPKISFKRNKIDEIINE